MLSPKRVGRSKLVMRLVRCCHTPKCRARHVTVSPGPMSPEVTPPTAFSPVAARESLCRSMERAEIEHAFDGGVDGGEEFDARHGTFWPLDG